MKRKSLIVLVCFLLSTIVLGQKKSALKKPRVANNSLSELQNAPAPLLNVENSPALQTLLGQAVTETVNKFSAKGLTNDDFAVTFLMPQVA